MKRLSKRQFAKAARRGATPRVLLLFCLVITLCGCGFVPRKWYLSTLEYYQDGFDNEWRNVEEGTYIIEEKRDPSIRFGYLLRDLDGDGADEVLIGMIDDSEETKFTDVIIYHHDFGPRCVLSTGEGYYIYLCDDNVLRMDGWYGSQTKIDYLVYQSDNTFLHVDGGSQPGKYELTEF